MVLSCVFSVEEDRNIMAITIKNYSGFSARELLEDDYFIRTHKERTPESDKFWSKILSSGALSHEEYELACSVLKALTVRKERMSPERKSELWNRIQRSNERGKRLFRLRLWGICASVAASVLLVFLLNTDWMNRQGDFDESLQLLSQTEMPFQNKDVELVLPNRNIVIEETDSKIEYDSVGSVVINSKLVLQTAERDFAYNQLLVPNGKRSVLVLEDGTKMCVNAGTRVIYPNKFRKAYREIFVDGEVYLEVAHDENRPFMVKTAKMDVQVLGTSFNIMSYKEDTYSSVVLAEGLVRVRTENEEIKLLPNEMFLYSEEDGAEVKEVNAEDYVSWKDGIYVYHSESLSSILERIARYYGQEIVCEPEVAELKCSGKLDLLDSLDVLLNGLTYTVPVRLDISEGKYVFKREN